MSASKGNTQGVGFHYHIDPEATAHDLMNEATEWLQYARSLTRLLSDLIHEADTVDCQRLAHSLEAIGALTHMGVQCTAQAHARMCWENSGG
ncbi:hypothetical protein BJI69_19835 [Luteibacter rhizovicinus DSM 16549]|uniref:Uncharacterized protein n=1 Tax=Luteibacter rhizovicinus DSM 16549 TaxID=1440763 RepID=A0A0G9HBI5_9GAMM|nr:hypothetical protein [Luteibacter rhizovicinus]APG05931.1 hypothetical protein BJI69_19835 [Luteibacter rhizovicinus DSM 16549]KLD67120.1 hypothetical protein Y883_09160 [Luteibacter rhizovicinus DSM 16549]